MDKFLNISEVKVNPIINENIIAQGVSLNVLRLDELHPVVSGNKLFKLKYYLQQAKATNKNVVTYGGAFSNHLVATAYYCQDLAIKCKGIVRGEKPKELSATLLQCEALGMKLEFISRDYYDSISDIGGENNEEIVIPEGGFGKLGVQGASEILQHKIFDSATHVAISVGSATTLAGLILANNKETEIIAVPAVKNMNELTQRLDYLLGPETYKTSVVWDNYHFGGFAKVNKELIIFMNQFYTDYKIPTDRVYTSKLLFALIEKINENYFPTGSNIVAIHTGGLQGNQSFKENELIF